MTKEPHARALELANASPRCGARRRDGEPCRGAAMPNGRCRMHGGPSTGPRTVEGLARSRRAGWKHPSTGPRTVEGLARSRRAGWKHGYYSAEAKVARAEARATVRALAALMPLVP